VKKKALIIVGVAIVLLGAMFLFVVDGLTEGANVTVNGIDLSDIPDGRYVGEYDFKRWSNTVIVHVEDKRIIAIEAEDELAGIDSSELFRHVIKAQNTTVDAMTGATVTSKAYLKAIENALE